MGFVVAKIIAIFFGLSCLVETKAYYSVYILCALIGAIGVYTCYQWRENITRRERWIALLFAFFFSGMVTLGNYPIYTNMEYGYMKTATTAGIFFGAAVTGYHILLFMHHAILRKELLTCKKAGREKGRYVFILTFVLSVGFTGIYWYFTGYPGNLSVDSLNQISQIQSGVYSNHHPFWHTMIIKLWYDIGMSVFHEINGAAALYTVAQIVSISACFSLAVMTLYEAGMPIGFVASTLVIYAFSPYNHGLLASMWKDPLFSASLLLLICGMFRVFRDIGRTSWNAFFILMGGIGFGVIRNNGWPVLAATALASVPMIRKQYPLVSNLLLICMILTGIMKWPVLSLLHVEKVETTEVMTVPVQQIARVLWEGYELTDEERTFLNHISADPDEIAGLYNPTISDSLKEDLLESGGDYLKDHKWEYLRFWLKMGLGHPAAYLRAWIDQTCGYWNSGYKYWIFLTDVEYNKMGIERTVRSPLLDHLYTQYDSFYFSLSIFEPLRAIGLHTWMVMLVFFLCGMRKDKPGMFLSIPANLIWVVLSIVAPVNSEFRYAYPLFLCLPILLGMALVPSEDTV